VATKRAVRHSGGGVAASLAGGCAGGGGGATSRVRVRVFQVAVAVSSGDTTSYRSLGEGRLGPGSG
jgi:hypothetical protein